MVKKIIDRANKSREILKEEKRHKEQYRILERKMIE